MAIKSSPFRSAGRSTGVEIWRVENLTPVSIDKQDQGLFYTGDSYVILHTRGENSGEKVYDVHFWLGAETSQDEAGAAAIFATELDDSVGGKAKQYRQVQGAESPEFLQLFRNGVQYREGGVKSGFKHVEKDQLPPPALLRIKGKGHVRVEEVRMDVGSLSSGDIFVLDLYNKLTLWCGAAANVQEKARARDVVAAMKEARNGKPEVIVIEEGSSDDSASGFYATLGAEDPTEVTIQPAVADEDSADGAAFSAPHLYKISDAGTDIAVEEVKEQPLSRAHLHSDSAFVLAADGWLFVWQGKDASSSERKASLAAAQLLLQKLKLPHSMPVQLVKDGMEDTTFRQHFEWLAPTTPAAVANGRASSSSPAPPEPENPAAAKPQEQPTAVTAAVPETKASPAAALSTGVSVAAGTLAAEKAQAPGTQQEAVGSPSPAPKPAATPHPGGATESAKKQVAPASPAAAGPPPTVPREQKNADGVRSKPKASPGGTSQTSPGSKPSPPVVSNMAADSAPNQPGESPIKPSEFAKKLAQGSVDFVPKPQVIKPALPPKPAGTLKFVPGRDVIPYGELKGLRAEAGVDMTCKEDYLSTDDFHKVFGKSSAEFKAQPKWRQLQAKKDVGLF